MTKKVTIQVVDDATAETADLMVCMRLPDPGDFPDNQTSACTRCGHGVYFRPYAPRTVKRICNVCLMGMFVGP
ncbi:MAG TPA: hypothetical protein VL614_00570 [Acetobacteraceae bacterium]|jgi:hypothetical protein|nr:hypothetical protein [Acetobacteraceae bacterium]